MPLNPSRARSSVPFDWLMGILTAALMCGVLLDGWAHSHGRVDQSFFTPWHAVLYGSMAVNGLVLLATGIVGLRRGYAWRNALPPGYWTAALGVVVFLLAGGFDGWWHTAFGIESGIVLLISPPHLLLALGGAMVMSGPLQSIAAQYGRETGGWKFVGPAVFATWALVTLAGFFLAYAQPIEDGTTPMTMHPTMSDRVYPVLYSVDSHGVLARVGLEPKLDFETVDVSPDGKHIAYRVNRYQAQDAMPPSDIFVSNADGSNPLRITSSGRHDTQPVWSPDGKTIAFVSMPAETSGNFGISLISPNGGTPRELLSQGTTINQAAWSPDGRTIAFGSHRGVTDTIGTVDVANGKTQWLASTSGGSQPVWGPQGLIYASSSGNVRLHPNGGTDTTLVTKTDGSPAVSRDGKHIAYLQTDLGGEQLFVADADGSHARDVSQLSGLDVQDAAWAPDGRVLFIALGRRDPVATDFGKSFAMGAILLQAVLVAGATLLLVRRWKPPIGTVTFVLTFFSLAMAVQTDYYFYAIGALLVGVLADAALAAAGERVRSGAGFYALGLAVPLLFTAAFEITTVQIAGGSGWVMNLLLGAPLLAGAAGLLLAFCFNSPLGTGDVTKSSGDLLRGEPTVS